MVTTTIIMATTTIIMAITTIIMETITTIITEIIIMKTTTAQGGVTKIRIGAHTGGDTQEEAGEDTTVTGEGDTTLGEDTILTKIIIAIEAVLLLNFREDQIPRNAPTVGEKLVTFAERGAISKIHADNERPTWKIS